MPKEKEKKKLSNTNSIEVDINLYTNETANIIIISDWLENKIDI
jgi:hypothetical protein